MKKSAKIINVCLIATVLATSFSAIANADSRKSSGFRSSGNSRGGNSGISARTNSGGGFSSQNSNKSAPAGRSSGIVSGNGKSQSNGTGSSSPITRNAFSPKAQTGMKSSPLSAGQSTTQSHQLKKESGLNRLSGSGKQATGRVDNFLGGKTETGKSTAPISGKSDIGNHGFVKAGNGFGGRGNNTAGYFGQHKHQQHHFLASLKTHCTYNQWCHRAPRHCHWWYNYCAPIQTCSVECISINYLVVPCYRNGQLVQDARWYLGISGMFLPGRGIGVEHVEPGSPAAQIGLITGNVITAANGIVLGSDADFEQVLAGSNGLLSLEVVVAEGAAPQVVQLALQNVASSSF